MQKILIIDDNSEAARALLSLLEFNGHVAYVAIGGPEGLSAVSRFAPDIVFLDIGMPGLNGYQVAARIRTDPALAQPFLIAFTAWSDPRSVELCRQAGFDRHIAKTSPFDTLVAAIEDAIAQAAIKI